MEGTENKNVTQLKPPWGYIAWYKTFFDKVKSKQFDKFDKEIITLNITTSNPDAFFNGLRFLGLVNEDGTIKEKFEGLRKYGDEFKQNLKKIVEEAYNDLLSKVVIETAKVDVVRNYFLKFYGDINAERAMRIFLYLCQESSIPISEELLSMKAIETKEVEKKFRKEKHKEKTKKREESYDEDIIRLEIGKAKMILPKDDLESAIIFKDHLDLHIKRLQSLSKGKESNQSQ